MITNNHQDPAFPFAHAEDDYVCYGMTRREYFAGEAMQGILVADSKFSMGPDIIAQCAVMQADALLKALEATS